MSHTVARPLTRGRHLAGLVALALLGGLLVSLLRAEPAPALEPVPTFQSTFGTAVLSNPMGTAGDAAGNIYIADGPRVKKFNSAGTLVKTYSIESDLRSAYGVAVSPSDGRVYVSDTALDRIMIFENDGSPVGAFGQLGSGPSDFNDPAQLAFDSVFNLWVADAGNHRIKKFSSAGSLLAIYGSFGTGNLQFDRPLGIGTQGTTVYIADTGNHRVQSMSTGGAFLSTWGSEGIGANNFLSPRAIATNPTYLYVLDSTGVRSYTPGNGSSQGKIVGAGSILVADQVPLEPWGIASVSTNLVVTDRALARALRFSGGGLYQSRIGGVGSNAVARPTGAALSADGTKVLVADEGLDQVLTFTTAGAFVSAASGPGSSSGKLHRPISVAPLPNGDYWVAEAGNLRVQKFNAAGTSLLVRGGDGTADGKFKGVGGVAVDGTGRVYVTDPVLERVTVFDSGGTFLRTFTVDFANQGTLPMSIGVDGAGTLWIHDAGILKLRRFTTDGALLSEFPAPDPLMPKMAVNSDGSLLTVDSTTAFSQFAPSGALRRHWSVAEGIDAPDFLSPQAIAGGNGLIFVGDTINGRMTRFDLLVSGSGFVGLTPARVLDTRNGTGGVPAGAKLGPNSSLSFPVDNVAGVDPAATAVVLNVTATEATQGTYVTAYPSGSIRPGTANLLVPPNRAIPNLVTVKIGPDGRVSLYNQLGSVHLVADVFGYYRTGGGSRFTAVTPNRILDSRATPTNGFSGKVGQNQYKELTVAGAGGAAPADATAVVLNVTVTGGTAPSYLTVYPATGSTPLAANLLFVGGQTVSNLVTVPVSAGKVRIYNNVGEVDVVADLVGWYRPSVGDLFVPVEPARGFDTRSGLNLATPIGEGTWRGMPIAGTASVEHNATAVVLNVTATEGTKASYLTLFPSGAPPTAANLVFAAGETVPNAAIVGLSSQGDVRVFNQLGDVHVIGDVAGYFLPPG